MVVTLIEDEEADSHSASVQFHGTTCISDVVRAITFKGVREEPLQPCPVFGKYANTHVEIHLYIRHDAVSVCR